MRDEGREDNIEELMKSDDISKLMGGAKKAFETDLVDLSGTNPGLRKFINDFKEQLIGAKAIEVDELVKKLHGPYELCKNDFNDKHNAAPKTFLQQVKTLGGKTRRTAEHAAEIGAGVTAGIAAGALGIGSALVAPPLTVPIAMAGLTAVGAPMVRMIASDSKVLLLYVIDLAVNGSLEERSVDDRLIDLRRHVDVGNKAKHAEIEKQHRVQAETICEPRSLLESEMFTRDELTRTIFNHFDNNQNNRLNNGSFKFNGIDIDNLSISGSINDKELARTILQYQMVKHFGKFSSDGKDFHFDYNCLTNMGEFQRDLNDAHNHIEDYRVFHEAMNKVRNKVEVTPRMQNKIANIIIPALINNEYQSTNLGTKLADKLLEKGNKSILSRELTVKESELRQIAAKITRGDLEFARDKGYTR